MKYDFTSIMDRMGKDAIAVEALGQNPMAPKPPKEGFDVIPMWVADMNFPTVPTIPEAIIERAKHPAYGYFSTRKEYLDSIIKWHETRNDVTGLTPECIGYENGVLGGVITALNVYCSKGDNVLLHKPTYIGFTNSLTNNGYHIVHSDLVKDENGVWRMNISLLFCMCHQVLDLIPDPGLFGEDMGGVGDQGGLVDRYGFRNVVMAGPCELRHGFFQGVVIFRQFRPCSGQLLLHGGGGGIKHSFTVFRLPHRLEICVCF